MQQMCTSSGPLSSPCLFTTYRPSLLRRGNVSIFTSTNLFNYHRFRNPRVGVSASVVAGRDIDVSWFSPNGRDANDDYGGWATFESPVHKKKGLSTFVFAGVGTSIAVLFTLIAHFSLSRRGFKFQLSSPLHALHGVLMPSGDKTTSNKTTESDAPNGDFMAAEPIPEYASNAIGETFKSDTYVEKLERVIIPLAVDSTQQEATSVLKKLKIIENDVRADELCTRREYTRWLVRANSLLERNRKNRIVPSSLLSGSIIYAFDDVSFEDPDFGSIQALAEAGIIQSKLSGKDSSSDLNDSKAQGGVNFFPDRFISRQDLLNWKAQLDYEFSSGIIEKISRMKAGLMDLKEISSDASPELYMDLLAGDESILRNVVTLPFFLIHSTISKMGVTKFTEEISIPVAPARMFKALILDSHNLLPKLVPQSIASVELVGGDGGAGTVKVTKFAEGSHFKTMKHKIDVLDVDNLYCKNTLVEGDVLFDKLESVVYEAKFESSGDGGCVCKMTSEYHAKEGVEIKEEDIKEGKDKASAMYKLVEAYLLENPTAYA